MNFSFTLKFLGDTSIIEATLLTKTEKLNGIKFYHQNRMIMLALTLEGFVYVLEKIDLF